MGWYVLLRLRAHRLLVAAAMGTMLLTVSVLTALAGFSSAVGDAGVRHALQVSDRAATPLALSAYATRAGDNKRGAALTLGQQAYPGLPIGLSPFALADSYGLPPRQGQVKENTDLVELASMDRSRLRLLSGHWPGTQPVAGVIEVAIPKAATTRLGENATLRLADRLSSAPLTVRVVGVYAPLDNRDGYWHLDPLAGHGVKVDSTGSSNSVYGPLLIDDSVLSGGRVAQQSTGWLVEPDFGKVRADQLDGLAHANQAVLTQVQTGATSGLQAQSRFPALAAQLTRSLLVARSGLLVVGLQLTLLAAMTLILAARLLAEEREAENALLRARGAAPQRIVRLAAAEGLLLALPAAVGAPLLAAPLLRLLGSAGPLRSAGITLTPGSAASAWIAAGVAALCCAAVVTAPTLARYRTFTEARAKRSRRLARPELLRGGADVALLAIAVIGYVQLRQYATSGTGSGVITGLTSDRPSIDPLLVAAPTLALAAGAVLTLRLLPPLSRLGERLARRSTGLPAALTGWQLSRRPHRGAGPVLALALAAAIGTLAIGQNASWLRSQRDQADFRTSGEVRVTALQTNAFAQGAMLGATPGVTAETPVHRQTLPLADGRLAELVAVDSTTEAQRLPLRANLVTAPRGISPSALLGKLADSPDTDAERGFALPGHPQILSLDLRSRVTTPARFSALPPGPDLVNVQLVDRTGLVWSLPLGDLPEDGKVHTLSLDLRAQAGGGSPAYPLRLTGLLLQTPFDLLSQPANGRNLDLSLLGVRADGATTSLPAGTTWLATADWTDATSGELGPDGSSCTQGTDPNANSGPSTPVDVQLSSGNCIYGPDAPGIGFYGRTSVVIATHASGEPLAAVVDQRFLDATQSRIGSLLRLPGVPSGPMIRIVGVVSAIPGTGDASEQGIDGSPFGNSTGFGSSDPSSSAGAVLVDLPAYAERYAENPAPNKGRAPEAVEWWLGAAPGAQQRIAAELRSRPDVGLVYTRQETTASLSHDPLGSGPLAALFAAVGLAVALSAIGFGTDAAGTVRQRFSETAVLSALGLRRRDLARSTAVELALPVVLGLGVGLLLGELLTRLIVPLLVLTPEATRPIPTVLVDIPPLPLLALLAGIAAVPLLVAGLAGFRGGDTARRLRQPEES